MSHLEIFTENRKNGKNKINPNFFYRRQMKQADIQLSHVLNIFNNKHKFKTGWRQINTLLNKKIIIVHFQNNTTQIYL